MATDGLNDFQQRQEQHEAPLITDVLAWIASLRIAVNVDDIIAAVTAGSATRIIDAIKRARQLILNLQPGAIAEGPHAIESVPSQFGLRLHFDIRDPGFYTAVDEQGANAVREIEHETQLAIQRIVRDAYRNGWHPRVFAPMIHETIGLTTRQTVAVATFYRTQIEETGLTQSRAQAAAERYAERLRKQRAMTIARTETIAAATIARVAGFEQAGENGLFDRSRAYLEWDAVQTDPKEMCYLLDGTRVPLGSDFDGLLPPAHPNCRCTVNLVIE